MAGGDVREARLKTGEYKKGPCEGHGSLTRWRKTMSIMKALLPLITRCCREKVLIIPSHEILSLEQ